MKINRLLPLLMIVVCIPDISECSSNSTDPCQTYAVLDATSRNHAIRGNNGICDNQLVEGWYKVEIGGRHAEIPTVCLQNNVCGTQLPLRIDLDGKDMPTHNNTIEAYACTSYNVLGQWDCCVLRQKVKIKNCINFYVYHLKPTDRCPVAYCAQEIGGTVAASITRKRGDAFGEAASNRPSDTTEISTPSFSNTTATTDGTTTFVNATELAISSSNIIVTEQNVTENMTTVASLPDGVSETTTHYITTRHDSELSTDLYRNINITKSETSTTDQNNTVSFQTTIGASALNQTTDDSRVSPNTTARVSQSTIPIRECMNWPKIRCNDNKTECYLSPVNNKVYIACVNDSGCGILCDNSPDCGDESDESTCDAQICLEGQQPCPGRSGCHTDCDGREQVRPSTSNVNEVASVTANVTGTPEMSARFPNQTSPADIRATDVKHTVTEAPMSNVTETTSTVSTGTSDITITDANTAVTNDTAEHGSIAEHTTISRNEFVSSLSTLDYEATNGSAENVSVSQHIRNLTTEATRVFSTDTSPDVADTATVATHSISKSGNASFTEISLTTSVSSVTTGFLSSTDSETSQSTASFTEISLTTSVSSVTTGLLSSTDSETSQSTAIHLQTTPVSSRGTDIGQTETAQRLETTVSSNQNPSTSTFETTQPFVSSDQNLSTRTMETTQPLVSSDQSLSTRTMETTQPLVSSDQSLSTRTMETTQPFVTSDQNLSTRTVETTQPFVSSDQSLSTRTMETTQPLVSSDQSLSTRTMETTQPFGSTDSDTKKLLTITSEITTEESTVVSYVSSTMSAPLETTPENIPASTQDEYKSTGHSANFSTRRDTVTEAVSATSATDKVTSNTANTTTQYSSVTGSQPTSARENQTDQTVVTRTERKGLIYENFGLFVFLVVAGVIIAGIIIFGVIGYIYRRRLRTWNPTMAYQDAYGDMEKTNLSFGHDKHGIESRIPDFDILRDEKKFEETSLSQASTLALGPTPGRPEPPFDDTVGDWSPNKLTNGNPTQGVPQQNNGVSYITNGQTNEGFAAEDNVDGIVPVDELDTAPPRALFPWIENAEDTKL